MAAVAADPAGQPLCSDPAVRSLRLRQRTFGGGRTPTHRLVFESQGGAVRFLTVRHLAQDELIPADLT